MTVWLYQAGLGQTRTITGTVVDSLTRMPLPNVSVGIQGTHRGVLTDINGAFHISTGPGAGKLVFSATGYQTLILAISDSLPLSLTISLSKAYTTLQDFVVKGKRGKYRNKNNPAVDLIRQVIANKSQNGPGHDPYLSLQQYEKIRMLADHLPRLITDNKLLKRYHFMFENRDTLLAPGKSLIPVYIEETLSNNYYRQHPAGNKKIVLGRKNVDFGEYIDAKGISFALNRIYEDINIYDNTITAFTMQFLSPVAEMAPTFYMYFIRDTLEENGEKLIELYFTPRNPEDLLFRGTLYITLDGNYAIRRAELGVSKHINLNWVREFNVKLDFDKGPGNRYYLSSSDMVALFSPFPRTPGLYGQRTVSYAGIADTVLPDAVFKGLSVDTLPQAAAQGKVFWDNERPSPLSAIEAKTYTNTDSLKNMRSFQRLMDYTAAFTVGYKSAGKVDIGPIGSFYSFNPIEGQRFRFGARTNTKLSTRYFGESYVAYGTKDNRWKYYLSGAYAFNNKSIYTFPFHYLQVSYMNDTRTLGQENVFGQGNSFLASFSHGDNSKWLYNQIVRLSYIREFESHFSYNFGAKFWQQQPTGTLQYLYKPFADKTDTIQSIRTSELSVTLRWAPHETFFQNKAARVNIVNKYPILLFQYSRGLQGLLGGQYNYDAFHLSIYKRWYVAPIGFSDITVNAGWLGGNLPFPLLIIHPGNPSYYYSQNSYNMMNIGEFVSDHYAGLNIDHFFNGFFFNKVPGLKWLRLREVIGAKILYGGLRDINNPALNPQQMKFPLTEGVLSTYILGSQPYIEASVGIYNIFSVIRLDLVKRFTYLSHPNISNVGLRFSSNFNF